MLILNGGIIIKHLSRIPAFIISVIIAAVYAVFVVSLCRYSGEPSFDISHIEPDTEYMNIHETGGLAGVKDEMKYYKDGDRYFMEYEKNEPIELSKTEYLLCTNLNREYLEQYVEPLASDMFYYEVTLKKNSEEQIIPRKAYNLSSLGLGSFIYRAKKKSACR